MFGFLGLMLGVTAGALTGVAVKGLISDPVVTGGGAVAFYAAFGISSLMTMYVMLNYVTVVIIMNIKRVDILSDGYLIYILTFGYLLSTVVHNGPNN